MQTLNEATKYAPPHCLNFDRGATLKSGQRTTSASSIPDVHVTIQNITLDGSSFPSSAGLSVVASLSPSMISQYHVPVPNIIVAGGSSLPSTTSSYAASPSSVISQSHVTAAISHLSPPNSAPSALPLMYQPSYTPSISAPFQSTSASLSALS